MGRMHPIEAGGSCQESPTAARNYWPCFFKPILTALHNAQIEQFGGAVYEIQPYMIPRNILLLRINRVWDSGAYLEPNSMDTEQYL